MRRTEEETTRSSRSKEASRSGRPKAVGPGVPVVPSSKRTTARASVRGSIRAPAESAAAVCSKRLFGSSLSVVSRCTPAFQSKAPRAPDVAPRTRCQSAEPPSPSARSDGLSPARARRVCRLTTPASASVP